MTPSPAPSVRSAAARVVRELRAQQSSPGTFDPSRYFRATDALAFLNVRTPVVRALGRTIAREHRQDWRVDEAVQFADILLRDRHLEIKGAGVEVLACFRRQFTPALLATVKRWLAANRAANWATTDSICGSLLAPLLLAHPHLVSRVATWTRHTNLWVRRASAVALVKLAARGQALDAAYGVADALLRDPHDLIHKAVGWLLRESGRTDPARLQAYLRARGPALARTTVRYAIEKFPPDTRRALLAETRPDRATPVRRPRTAGPRPGRPS